MGALVRQDLGAIGGRMPGAAPLEGLEGPAGGLPFLGLSLDERQQRAFLEAGLEFVADGPWPEDRWRLLVRADVAVSRGAIERFLVAARAAGRDARWQAYGRVGNLADEVGLGIDGLPWLVALAPGGEVTESRLCAAEALEVTVDERLVEFPLPPGQFAADVIELPLTEPLVLPCGHWVQLLWANLLGLGPFLYRQLGGRNVVEMGIRLVGALARTRSTDPSRIMASYVRVGEQCAVHPSAVVESSWLADGVEVQANAVVRGCVLGEGAIVEPLALVEGSVVGPRARVQRQAMVKYSVLGNGALAAGDMQLGVLDRGASLKKTAALLDQSIGGTVRVQAGGRLVRAPLGLAGVGVGARTVVGANVFVSAGRHLPADLVVVPARASVLQSIPEEVVAGAYEVVDGALVRVVRNGASAC